MGTDSGSSASWIVYLIFLGLIFGGMRLWDSSLRYAFQYGVNLSDVNKDPKPHDCDWLKAPIGDKECHCEVDVTKTKVSTGTDPTTGIPIISYDDGITWNWDAAASAGSNVNSLNPPSVIPSQPSPGPYPTKHRTTLYVGWKKIEE
jgi:hypothetical protein